MKISRMLQLLLQSIFISLTACSSVTLEAPAPTPSPTPTFVPVPTMTHTPSPSINDAQQMKLSVDGKVFDTILSPDGKSIWLAYESGECLSIGKWELTNSPNQATAEDLEVRKTSCPAREARLSISTNLPFLGVSIGRGVLLLDTSSEEFLDSRDVLTEYVSPSTARGIAFSPVDTKFVYGSQVPDILNFGDWGHLAKWFRLFKSTVPKEKRGPEYDQAKRTGLDAAHVFEFSPDGRLLAAGGGHFVGLWDVQTADRLQFRLGYDFVQSISFAPDSRSMVFVNDDGKLYWWNLAHIWEKRVIDDPKLIVDGVVGVEAVYAPDGKTLAIGMSNGSVQFRDAEAFRLIKEVHTHANRITSLQFSQDGSQLFTGSLDGSVRLWDVPRLLSVASGDPTAETVNLEIPVLGETSPLNLTGIQMIDEENGWATDSSGHLLRTSDGGYHWQVVSPTNMMFHEEGLFIRDALTAWATPTIVSCNQSACLPANIEEAVVWRTDDGGKNWVASRPFPLGRRIETNVGVPYFQPRALQFVDSLHGWLLASVDHRMRRDFYRLFYTQDGGTSWVRMIDETDGPPLIEAFSVAFLDGRHGFLAGEGVHEKYDEDNYYYSDDSGSTWNRLYLRSIGFKGTRSDDSIRLSVLSTDRIGLDLRVQEIRYISLECERSTIERHVMLSFHPDHPDDPWSVESTDKDVGFIYHTYYMNDTHGWTFVIPGPGLSNYIQRTRDGGATWELLRRVAWEDARFSFVDEKNGWAVVFSGEESALVHTTNGGESWEEIQSISIGSRP